MLGTHTRGLLALVALACLPATSAAYDGMQLRWYEWHLHPGNSEVWAQQNNGTFFPSDPDGPCTHSCRHPYDLWQDCYDNGLDGCGHSHHTNSINRASGRAWLRGGTDVYVDPCSSTGVQRDPNGWTLADGSHTLDELVWLEDQAELFMANHPGFLAWVEKEFTVSNAPNPPTHEALKGGHKVSTCTEIVRPYCHTGGGGGTAEYYENQCYSEGDLYDASRGSCVLAWAHPCQANAGLSYLGPFDPVTRGGSDYDLLVGYAVKPQVEDSDGCLFTADETTRTGEWDALSWHSVLDHGIWVHTQSDNDAHNYNNFAPGVPGRCLRAVSARAGRARRTGCWVAGPHTKQAVHEARLARRCYYAEDRTKVEVWAWAEDPLTHPGQTPLAIMGGEFDRQDPFWIEVRAEKLPGTVMKVELDDAEIWRNGQRLRHCDAIGNPERCQCDGTRCTIVIPVYWNITGWYALHVTDDDDPGVGPYGLITSKHEALVSMFRVNPGQMPDPDADADGDGVPDASDNCPFAPNGLAEEAQGTQVAQSDADGDGEGDACECGDADGNGIVDTSDARIIQLCVVGAVPCPALCDVTGEGDCSTTDARIIQLLTVGKLDESALLCAARGN